MNFVSSLKLTLILLLGLALAAVFGTFSPASDGRYTTFYQSFWFRTPLLLLALNTLACTIKTILRNLQDRRRHFEALPISWESDFEGRFELPGSGVTAPVAERFHAMGFRTMETGERLVAHRGRLGRWGSTLTHVSVLVVMIGAVLGNLGFVGTLNIRIGDSSRFYYDWDTKRDKPLGFEFRLDHFQPIYYPIELQIEVWDPVSQERLEVYAVKEGESFRLPGVDFTAKVEKFDPAAEVLIMGILRGGNYLGEYRISRKDGVSAGPLKNYLLHLRPLAFRDPVLKQMHSEVSLLEEGKVVKQGTITVNHPLTHNGTTIYQTAFNLDPEGNWYAGFQFTRDPGEPLVWVGSVLLILGVLLAFFVPYRVLGVMMESDRIRCVPLVGFAGEGGRKALLKVQDALKGVTS